MNIAVDGNFFYLGWMACFLGLPRKHPAAPALKQGDLDAFLDGWDMCMDTPTHGRPARLEAFYDELKAGHIVVMWVDDDNREIQGVR